jgi:hypothetical protein
VELFDLGFEPGFLGGEAAGFLGVSPELGLVGEVAQLRDAAGLVSEVKATPGGSRASASWWQAARGFRRAEGWPWGWCTRIRIIRRPI